MSDNNRDLFGKVSKPKDALLDELDSLKELLDEEGEDIIMAAPWEFTPTEEPATIEIEAAAPPEPDEVIELTTPADFTSQAPATEYPAEPPLLDEVVFTEAEAPTEVPELIEAVDSVEESEAELPGNDELPQLVEMLVQRRLEKLKPALTEGVLQQLERLYPSLKKH